MALKKDVLERLKARTQGSRRMISVDADLRYDIDDAILEIQRLRKALADR